jgi:hypothetical protein
MATLNFLNKMAAWVSGLREYAANVFLNSITRLTSVIQMQYVFFNVWTEFMNVIKTNF